MGISGYLNTAGNTIAICLCENIFDSSSDVGSDGMRKKYIIYVFVSVGMFGPCAGDKLDEVYYCKKMFIEAF